MKVLVVESTSRGNESFSNRLAQSVLQKLKEKNLKLEVSTRNLDKDPVLDSEAAISELKSAEVVIIGVPMHNFSIPIVLKAWIDQVVRPGQSFRYGASGPEGLIRGKKAYLAIASGGVYSEGPMSAYDFTEPYLKAVLGFIGISDLTTFRIEGVDVPGLKDIAFEKAVESIRI